eukprot:4868374-Prorocentrum_lima.AAC.1
MTSSLVGSEMCIRDSLWRMNTEAHGHKGHQPAAANKLGRARRLRDLHPPVSYTHLTLPTICSV